ncbi:hypothetical protein CMI37_20220 [Candidatus Pacearchaeota archaeon]|nr:hypothetical protein [Candidatus Pacearchaeota archaeon]|tara:strand:- start:133 stop:1617 length:1485 start_codon:yes stop_codon:yes gene_type:complete
MLFINPKINPKSETKLITSFIYTTFPTSIGFLAGYLREKNEDKAQILDENILTITDTLLREEIEKIEGPKIVGISCLTTTAKRTYELAEKIKKIDPEILVVVGGIHPTVVPNECLSKKNVDVVIKGEGEETLSKLYEAIKTKKEYGNLKGISYRQGEEIIHNPPRPLIDMDDLSPFPYDLFEKNIDNYRDFGTIITSRGCPFQCIYCSQRSISGGKYRHLSTEKALQEIGLLVDKYEQKKIWFMEDNLSVNKKRLLELLDGIIERGYNKKTEFIGGLRSDSVDYEILRKMKQANFTMLEFGFESGSDRLLKILDKGQIVQDNVNAILKTHEMGMKASATFIFGIPDETRAERLKTYRLAKKLPLDNIRFNVAIPYPGTRLYNIAKSEGSLKILKDWKNFNVQYYMMGDDIPYVPRGVNKYTLMYDTMKSNLFFYLRPEGIISLLKSPLSGGGVISMPQKWYLSLYAIFNIVRLGSFLGKRFLVISFKALYKNIF